MSRWQIFYRNIQQDLKLFLFSLFLLCLFRALFISLLSQYMKETTTFKDMLSASYFGLRISMKSAGVGALLAFVFCTLPSVIMPKWNLEKSRLWIGYVYNALLLFIFVASIPFYKEFHVVYSLIIFNTFRDDTRALFNTLVQQYHLWANLLVVVAGALVAGYLLKQILKTKTYKIPRFSPKVGNILFRTGLIVVVFTFMLFTRFGGSFTSAKSIYWENSAVLRDDFLNEAILDGVQALYRSYSTYKRLREASDLHIDAVQMAQYAKSLSAGDISSNNLDDYVRKSAQGSSVKKTKHIIVIIAESYGNWALLPNYKELNVANGMQSIIARDNAVYVPAFVPNAVFTIPAVNGIITGFVEMNLTPNYQSETYKAPYSTAFASQMKKLGYKTKFWLGGFTSWQRIKDFAKAQGFDEVYGCNDIPYKTGNSWGCDDKYLFDAVAASLKDDEPSFNVILTTSNHPAYTVDLESEGFDESIVLNGLADNQKSDKELIKKLGHFWYADKVIANFIQTSYERHPESLFVMTGDHNKNIFETNLNLYEQYGIPLVIFGQGIHKDIFPEKVTGGQINIIPTVIELVAPQGFEYYSLGESLTRGNQLGINNEVWITPYNIGRLDNDSVVMLPGSAGSESTAGIEHIKEKVKAAQALSWWRVNKGKYIN